MAGFEDVREELTERFSVIIREHDSALPVYYDNQRFDNPRNGSWVYFALIPNLSYRANLGTVPVYRMEGVFNIACMVPQNDGTKNLYELADAIVNGMNNKNLQTGSGTISVDRSVIKNRGVIEGWRTMNVQGEYRYDFQYAG